MVVLIGALPPRIAACTFSSSPASGYVLDCIRSGLAWITAVLCITSDRSIVTVLAAGMEPSAGSETIALLSWTVHQRRRVAGLTSHRIWPLGFWHHLLVACSVEVSAQSLRH